MLTTVSIFALALTAAALLFTCAVLIFYIRSSRRTLRQLVELKQLLEEEDLLESDASSN